MSKFTDELKARIENPKNEDYREGVRDGIVLVLSVFIGKKVCKDVEKEAKKQERLGEIG